jgi:hypothetical protein
MILPLLLPDVNGRYEVLFDYPERWGQSVGTVVEAPDQRAAVALACRQGGWVGCPLRGLANRPEVLPIGARVRYEPDNPNRHLKGIARCPMRTATRSSGGGYGREFERFAAFAPTREGLTAEELNDPENWVQV